MDQSNQPWVVYDAGPRNVRSPIICLPPVCGMADVFFRQMASLSVAGIRIISVSIVCVWCVWVGYTYHTQLYSLPHPLTFPVTLYRVGFLILVPPYTAPSTPHTPPQVEYPVYWTTDEFCDGFIKLLDHLQLDKVHTH